MNTTFKKIVSVLLTVIMLCGIAPVALLAQAASSTPTVQIVSFMRGAQTDLRSSELLEARVSGYDGNVQELTYKWTNTLGTYLYIYNSHNMYSINNTDGEVEIYNEYVKSSENMAGRSYLDTFTGKGYAWAAVYGASISGSSLDGEVTVEVYDKNGNFLCSDSHTGEYSNRRNKGFVTYNLDADMDNVVIGLFEGDKRNVKDLLGESAIVHITCTASKVSRGKIVEGAEHILLTTEADGNYYITGTNAGTSTGVNGDAQVDLTIKKENCKFHNKQSGSATTTVFVFKKPTTSTTTTTLTLTGNLDDRCDYFIAGTQGEKQADGTILFTGLTPNTAYAVEVRGEYTDKNGAQKYAYAYVYDTTKPVYLASVYTYLDGALTDIAALHGEEVELYLLNKDEDATLPGANFIALSHSATGTYTATVENGIYYPWHDDGPEYHLAREYKLVVENANGDLHLHHYSVNYDTNGGAFRTNENPGTEIFSSATAVNATTKVPVRDGYVFAGWKYGESTYAAGAQVTNSITAPMTLVAQWEKAVNVTINVTINHKADGGFDYNENRDELTVDFLEMKKDSPAFVETGDRLFFSKEGVTDEKGNAKAFEYTADVQGTAVLETRYTATAPTYTGLLESSYFGVALSKSGYDVGVIEKIKDENGNWTINIPLTYNPDDFDLEFSVEMADDVPKELYPDAVIVKIACWDAEANEWVIITQQRTTENTVRPGIRVDIDENGNGSGSYPVWKYEADGDAYGYRAVVTGFIYGDSTIIVPTEKDHAIENGNVIIAYTDGNYTATMSSVSDGQKFGTYLNGAYYSGSTDSQAGTLDAVITVEKYNVTFDAQGGKVNGNNTQTVADQYYIPDFDSYQPVMEDHNFLGWYLDTDCTIPATEGELLVEDVTVYAKWDRVLTGELIVDGYYTDSNGVQHVVDITSRAKQALVELKEITPDGTYNIDGQVVTIEWVTGQHFSAPVAYMFKGLDPDKTYRIDVYLINYDAAYQNSTTVINGNGDIHDDYNKNDYTAVYTDENKLSTFVNVFMHFEPEEYFQPVEVDASRIGEGFRPSQTLVEYYYSMNVDSEYSIITQHKSSPFGVSVNMNGAGYNDGVYGCEVWNEVYNGTLYDYQANLTKINGTDVSEWPVIVTYGDPARYSPLNDAPTGPLKVEIIPMWYNVIYDLNTAADDSDRETVFSGHIWSYETVISEKPVRDGYVFGGWYSDEACTDGNEVTTIAASVHEDTILYAKWEKRTDLELTVNHVDKLTNETLASETKTAQVFDTVYTAESLKKDFTGYSYDSASAESVTITTGTNEITLYYTINSYGYTVNYLEKGTDKVLATAKTGTANYNQTVTETALAIKGYNLVGSDSQSIVIDTENNVINFYYAINSYGYTVNYLEKGTDKVLATAKTGTANYNQTVTETALTIKGYSLVGSDSQSIVIDTENNVITFYYTINSYGYTVNYLEKGTDKVLATAKTGTANYNQTVTENAVAIKGYNLVGSDSQSIVIDTENNSITFFYAKKNDLTLTVKYVDKATNSTLAADTKTAQVFGTVYTAESLKKTFTGYTYDSASAESVTITTGTNEITLYYTINSYGYTVNYLEKGTNKVLSTAKTGTANYNQTVTETAIAITGYNLVGADSQSIVIDTENNVINFYYAKINNLSLTVAFIDKSTGERLIADRKVNNLVYGETVKVASLAADITGYKYVESVPAEITVTSSGSSVYIYYEKATFSYTVEYYYDNVLDSSKTENMTALYQSKIYSYEDKGAGYILGSVGNLPLTIGADASKNVIRVYYFTDKVGGGEFGTTPDSNPDIYQKQVIFRVVNGTWADTTTRTIVKYVNLKTDGRWDVNGTATITAPTGMIAAEGYHNGSWNTTPPTTVKGTDTELYVYTFKAINETETPEVSVDPDYSLIPGTPGTKQVIVFGKTEGIGWYRVSKDGGKTYDIVFGNSTYEVDYGEEIMISVGDLLIDLDSYAFFVNEQFVPADKDGNLVLTVKGYMLIRAMGYTKLPVPDTDNDADSDSSAEDETPLNWFQRIIKAIREFFEKLFGIKK